MKHNEKCTHNNWAYGRHIKIKHEPKRFAMNLDAGGRLQFGSSGRCVFYVHEHNMYKRVAQCTNSPKFMIESQVFALY